MNQELKYRVIARPKFVRGGDNTPRLLPELFDSRADAASWAGVEATQIEADGVTFEIIIEALP